MSDLVLPNYQVIKPPNTVPPRHTKGTDTHEQLEVQFSFQKIEVNFSQGGASCSDDWTAGDGDTGGPHRRKLDDFVPYLISLPPPRDAATGQASGKRQWKPFRLVVPIDGTVQTLLKAACANKTTISSIVVTKGSPGGTRIKLTDVRITRCLPCAGPSGKMDAALAFLLLAADCIKLGYPAHDSWLTT